MGSNRIKAFIFDLDGTLIDTERIYRMLWPKAVEQMGYTLSDEMYLSLRSLGRPYAPKRFEEWFGSEFDYDQARIIRKKYFDEYIEKNGIQLKSGAIELLTYLRNKGYITAIATATDLKRAGEYMDMTGLTGYFDRIISATQVDEGKPSPKVYLYACEQLSLQPAECIAVEDAPNGITSAYGAGLECIMVPDLTGPDEDIETKVVYVAESLHKIIDYVENLEQ